MKNLIISGSSGFIGTNFVNSFYKDKKFLSKFKQVVLVDTLQYGKQKIDKSILKDKKFKFIKASIYNKKIVTRIVNNGDVIVHMATDMNTFDNPQKGVDENIDTYLKILSEKNISKFVFFSTANIYGINHSSNLLETDLPNPTTFYSAKKIAFEALLKVYFVLHNFPVVIFRPVSIFGPYQYPGWLVPLSVKRLLNNEKIQLTSGGKVKRDWIYVDDVCDLTMRCLKYDKKDIFGEIYNVGTGTEETVLEIAHYILEKFNKPKTFIKWLPERPGDLPREITKALKAKKRFKWVPKTSFYKGLDITIDWFLKHQNYL